jgi:hypothetical protein
MLVGTKKCKMLLFLHLGGGVDHGPILSYFLLFSSCKNRRLLVVNIGLVTCQVSRLEFFVLLVVVRLSSKLKVPKPCNFIDYGNKMDVTSCRKTDS